MPLVLTHQSYLQPLIEFAIIQTAALQSSQNTFHYNDAIMSAMSSQITSLTIVYSSVYSGTIQRKHQNSASLVFVCVCVCVWGGGGGGGGGSPVTVELPSQRVSYVENVSISWRHHAELLPKDHLQSNIWPEDDVLLIVIVDGDGRA